MRVVLLPILAQVLCNVDYDRLIGNEWISLFKKKKLYRYPKGSGHASGYLKWKWRQLLKVREL